MALERVTHFLERRTRFLERGSQFLEREMHFLERGSQFLERRTRFLERESQFLEREAYSLECGPAPHWRSHHIQSRDSKKAIRRQNIFESLFSYASTVSREYRFLKINAK